MSEDGAAATVTVQLNPNPGSAVTSPINVGPGESVYGGVNSLSMTSLTFASGETVKMFTVPAIDDGNENLMIAFGDLPPGASVGSQAIALTADDEGVEEIGRKVMTGAQEGRPDRNAARGVQ